MPNMTKWSIHNVFSTYSFQGDRQQGYTYTTRRHIQSTDITPAPSVCPRTHACCTRQDMNISADPQHCAGRAALSELQQEEIEDEEQANQQGLALRQTGYVAREKARLIVDLISH